MSCFLPTLPQTFITEWHTHGNVPPCPSSGYFKGNCLFLKGNWSTGGGFTFPLMQTGNCSQLQWSYTEAWRADTLLGSVLPKMPSGCWAGSGGAAQGRGAFPLPLLSTAEATPGAPSTNLTWVCWNGSMEGRLRGLALGSWSKRKPRGHLANVHKDLTGRNKDRQGFSQCPLKGQQAMK